MPDLQVEWRCEKCRTLLGYQHADRLYLRFRKSQFVIIGTHDPVIATCGVCGRTDERPNEIVEAEASR